MRKVVLLAFVFAAAVLSASLTSSAQQQPSPFSVPSAAGNAAAAAPPSTAPGVVERMWAAVLAEQSKLNRQLASSVKDLKQGGAMHAAMTLVMIAFFYGVLHAAGPGHGKAVISAYVLANEETVRRGIMLSFLSALFQALSAITFVGILAVVLNQTSLQMRNSEAFIETVSWGLVALVGAALLYHRIAALLKPSPSIGHDDNRGHRQHAHAPEHAHAHHHGHAGAHGPGCGCGHAHIPEPSQLTGSSWSWRKALPLALSVGIRPCSGALLLLIFALSQGLFWAGVLGTFAMALGTAITVSILAALAVSSRNFAQSMTGHGSVWANRIGTAAGLLSATLVFGFGALFFIASLKGGSPL